MKTTNNTIKSLISTSTLTAALTIAASATTIIIEDTFTRTGDVDGSLTDTGQTWNSPSGTQFTDGSTLQTSSYHTSNITGITFATNCTYKLSMDVALNNSSNFWVALGYGTQHINSTGMMIHEQGNAGLFTQNVSGKQSIGLSENNLKNFEITLQTGATLSNSIASWKIDGVTVGSSRAVNASGISGVFVQSSGSGLRGTVDNFKLTHDCVPEPSSTLLLGLGGLSLILRRKRAV